MEQEKSVMNYEDIERTFPVQVKEIKMILEDKYGISIPSQSEQFVIRCLRLKDGNKDKAIKLIKTFDSIIKDLIDWETPLSPSLYEDVYKSGIVVSLANRDSEGRRIIVVRSVKWTPPQISFEEGVACLWMLGQYINSEFLDIQRHGFITVWDFSNFSFQQAWAVKQWKLIQTAKWLSNGVGGRIKAFHAIHHPRVIGVLYSGMKPFLKEKLRKRVFFHDTVESLHKSIGVGSEHLPAHIGGKLPDGEGIDKHMQKELLLQDNYFKELKEAGFPSK